jgi:hypothetical protein
VLRNELIEDGSALGQALQSADPSAPHQMAMALHICRKDCDELTADLVKV